MTLFIYPTTNNHVEVIKHVCVTDFVWVFGYLLPLFSCLYQLHHSHNISPWVYYIKQISTITAMFMWGKYFLCYLYTITEVYRNICPNWIYLNLLCLSAKSDDRQVRSTENFSILTDNIRQWMVIPGFTKTSRYKWNNYMYLYTWTLSSGVLTWLSLKFFIEINPLNPFSSRVLTPIPCPGHVLSSIWDHTYMYKYPIIACQLYAQNLNHYMYMHNVQVHFTWVSSLVTIYMLHFICKVYIQSYQTDVMKVSTKTERALPKSSPLIIDRIRLSYDITLRSSSSNTSYRTND